MELGGERFNKKGGSSEPGTRPVVMLFFAGGSPPKGINALCR
jgi:hypothetical protein